MAKSKKKNEPTIESTIATDNKINQAETKKEESTMSQNEATNGTNATTDTKTYKYFDLDTLEQKEETVPVNFTPAESLDVASERVTAIAEKVGTSSDEIMLKALNAWLKQQVLNEAEKSVVSKGGKKSVVMAVCKPFRSMPPFSTMYVLDSNGKIVKETYTIKRGERKGQTVTENKVNRIEQTKAILKLLKSNPEMIESIRTASQVVGDDNENEEDNED